jgi:hypothetical protein
LSSSSDITWAKVCDRRNPGSLGNHGRLSNLQRGTNGTDARRVDTLRKMMDRLSMRPDERYIGRTEARLADHP